MIIYSEGEMRARNNTRCYSRAFSWNPIRYGLMKDKLLTTVIKNKFLVEFPLDA